MRKKSRTKTIKKDPAFREHFRSRGVISSNGRCSRLRTPAADQEASGDVVDDETVDRALNFIERAHASGKPFYVWWNGARIVPHPRESDSMRGISGQDERRHDGMVRHEHARRQTADKLDELGRLPTTHNNRHYSTDNGPHETRPDAASSPSLARKTLTGKVAGGCRRWCAGRAKSGGFGVQRDHAPYGLVADLRGCGCRDIKEQYCCKVAWAIGRTYKVHLDGYNFLPHLR